MADRSASRRAFLGAASAGAATVGGLSLGSAQAAAAAGGGTSAPRTGQDATGQDAAPPAVAGTLTKTFMFSDAQGFKVGAVSPIAWNQGGYQPGAGFIDLALNLDAGAVIKRIDIYVQRVTAGSVLMSLNRSSVTTDTSGTNVDTITTASGTGPLTGGKAMTLTVGTGEQYYLESQDFTSANVTFVGAIVTYVPAPTPVTPPPTLTARSVTFTASKKSVAKGKKVTLSGSLVSAAQACLAAQTVLVEKSTGGAFKPAGSLTTDASGAFTNTQKVKKKTQYRVSVAATATCAAAQSPTLTVKVT